jgi:hypothetical protein
MAELRFGADGYLDLSDLPDGDPDTVLPPDELAALHDALAGAHPELDDTAWDGWVHAVVTDDVADDLVVVAVPGAEGAPFALDDWADGADHGVEPIHLDDTDEPGDHHDVPPIHLEPTHDDDAHTATDHDQDADDDAWAPLDDVYHLDLELTAVDHDDGEHDGDDTFTPDEDEHYDF